MDLQKYNSNKLFVEVRVQLSKKPEFALSLEEKNGFCDFVCHHLRTADPLGLRLHFTLQGKIYMH